MTLLPTVLSWARNVGASVMVSGLVGQGGRARVDLMGESVELQHQPGQVPRLIRFCAGQRPQILGHVLTVRQTRRALTRLGYG